MKIAEISLYRVALPLVTPYRLSYRLVETFEPILIEVRGSDGRTGWGEAHISPGSSAETPESGWRFACAWAERLVGQRTAEAKVTLAHAAAGNMVAATGLIAAFEMVEGNPLLEVSAETRLPVVTPIHATEPAPIADEVDQRLAEGFHTFKIKVGKDVDADLARVTAIQKAAAGRARLRVDANRAYSQTDGCRFAAALDPAGIDLFEQPCAADDWAANAAVAAVSTVPLMLDEPICTLSDIERAATIPGVRLCKLKLKRFGGLDRLRQGLDRVWALGLEPVLGDGLGSEISCWMEACVARTTIGNAGEFNGFFKPRARLFAEPLAFEAGAVVLPAGYWPQVDRETLARHTVDRVRFAPARVAAGA